MRQPTAILILGMGGLLMGLLALQFSWMRALVDARSDFFDEQARTALVEVQSVSSQAPSSFPGLAFTGLGPSLRPAGGLWAEACGGGGDAGEGRAIADSLLRSVLRTTATWISNSVRPCSTGMAGPCSSGTKMSTCSSGFQDEGYRIPAGDEQTLEEVQLYTVIFPQKSWVLANMWVN